MKQLGIILLATSLVYGAMAQPFSIDWHKIAGGGGTSSGGSYAITGTIGQHDAGRISGGNYTLEGGFISGLIVIQTPGAPELSIQLSGENAIISWAADTSNGFALQEASDLNSAASWNPSEATIQTSGNIKSVTVPANAVRFYRLHKQ